MKRSSIRLQYNAPVTLTFFFSGIGLLNKQLDNLTPV